MRKSLLVILTLLVTAGCALTPHKRVSFILEPAPQPPPCTRKITLYLPTLKADAPYDTSLMAYSLSPLEVEFYAYHQWAAPLPRLVTQAIREDLRRWGCVTLAPLSHRFPILQGRITRFLHRFQGDSSWGEVAIDFKLVERNRVVAQVTFHARVKAQENTPKGGAQALNQALERVIGQLERWLETETTGNTEAE